MKKGKDRRKMRCLNKHSDASDLPLVHIKPHQSPRTPPLKTKKKTEPVITFPEPYDKEKQQQQLQQFIINNTEHEHIYLIEQIEHLQYQENLYPPTGLYLSTIETDITPNLRSVITDYMVRVCQNFKLSDNTLFLSISILDRFLASSMPYMVSKDKLRIISLTSVLIASKYNDVEVPPVNEIAKECNSERTDILALESIILNTLQFTLSVATVNLFLQLYFQFWKCDSIIKFMSQFVCEVALQDYGTLLFTPSDVAYSSIHLCKYIDAVNKGMTHDPDSFQSCVSKCVMHLLECVSKISRTRLIGTIKKFSTEQNMNVANTIINAANCIRSTHIG